MIVKGKMRGCFSVTVVKGDKQRVFGCVTRDKLKQYVELGLIDDRVNENPVMIDVEDRELKASTRKKRMGLLSGNLDYQMEKGGRV
jgi:hypothetical protein